MAQTAKAFFIRVEADQPVNGFTWFLYIVFIVSFFLHLSARIPGIGVLRPDMLLAASIVLMLFLQQSKLKNRFANPCSRYLSLFLAYILISLPFVEWPGSVLRGNLEEFIKVAVFFYFTLLVVDTDSRMKWFIFLFMICQIIRVLEPLILHEMYGYWGSRTYLGAGEFAGRLGGAPSDVINPNGLALVIATLFPFLHYLWGNGRWPARLGYLSLVPPLLYALVLTLSRSGFVAMLIIVWNIFVKSRHKIVLILVAVAIAVFAWTNMTDIQKDRYLSLTGRQDVQGASSFQGRIDGMKAEVGVALESPIVGHGIGTSQEAKYHVIGGTLVSHNLYLELLIETGIIGFVIYMLFIKSVYHTLKQTSVSLRQSTTPDKKSSAKNQPGPQQTKQFERKLLLALTTSFWMYIVFSLAQYGVSEYHWYFLAGEATVLQRRTSGSAAAEGASHDPGR